MKEICNVHSTSDKMCPSAECVNEAGSRMPARRMMMNETLYTSPSATPLPPPPSIHISFQKYFCPVMTWPTALLLDLCTSSLSGNVDFSQTIQNMHNNHDDTEKKKEKKEE